MAMNAYWAMFKRELVLHRAHKSEWLAVLLLFVIFASLFPIALGAWSKENARFAPIIIWVATMITTVLAQENLLRADFKLGTFDAMLLSQRSFSTLILIKAFAHWTIYALPIVLFTPLVAYSFALPATSIIIITSSLLVGSIFLTLMALLGGALTVPLARGGVFLAMLILPLYVPVLCLGCEIGLLSLEGIFSNGHFALLLALVIIAVLCVPFAVATAIKVSIE